MSTVRIITERAKKVSQSVWDEVVMLVRDVCLIICGMMIGAVIMAAVVLK